MNHRQKKDDPAAGGVALQLKKEVKIFIFSGSHVSAPVLQETYYVVKFDNLC